MMLLFVVGMFVLAQEPVDSTAVNVDVITGGTVVDFLKNNMWVLIFIVYSLLEAWFGQTNLIKEGSVIAFIWNWVGRIIKKQLPTVKGKFMTNEQLKAVKKCKSLLQF